MKIRWPPLLILILVYCPPLLGQSTSCLDSFRDFGVLEPEVNTTAHNETYRPTIAWYGNCILVGSSNGLWLYDPEQPDNPARLAHIEERAINNVAVSPFDMTIAFNVAQESTVYLINPDGNVSSVTADGQAVTDISFSHDGSLMAVASSVIEEYEGTGHYFDARVQIWNSDWEVESTKVSEAGVIPYLFFNSDNRHILTHEVDPGYFGDEVRNWDIASASSIWSYYDLLGEYQTWSANDPVAITSVTMAGDIVALGGVYGYFNDRNFYGIGVHLWNAETAQRQLEISIRARSHEEYVYELSDLLLAFDSSGSVLATSTGIEMIQLWDTDNGNQIGAIIIQASQILQISFSPDSRLLAVLTEEGVKLYNSQSLEEIASFSPLGVTSDSK